MASIWSQGLVERWLGKTKASLSVNSRLAINDNGGSADTITDTGNGLGVFAIGDTIQIMDATNVANRIAVSPTVVAAGTLTFPTGTFAASQVADAGVTLTLRALYNQSMVDLLRSAQLDVYSGSRPSRPDDAEQGTLLASFTGLNFDVTSWSSLTYEGTISLYGGVQSCTAVATGQASWARLRLGQVTTTGASSSHPRIDMDCGVGSAYDAQLASTTITSGRPVSLESLDIVLASS